MENKEKVLHFEILDFDPVLVKRNRTTGKEFAVKYWKVQLRYAQTECKCDWKHEAFFITPEDQTSLKPSSIELSKKVWQKLKMYLQQKEITK